MKNKNVVIIDPYASGNLLPPAFRNKGFGCVAVHTKPLNEKGLSASFIASDFVASYVLGEQELDALVSQLKTHNIAAVLPGVETGVQLADQLAQLLDTNRNDIEFSEARRNKYLMQDAVRKAGVRHIKSTVVRTYQEAIDWIEKNTSLPIVVKPKESGGSDGVRKCNTLAEVKLAIESVIGTNNFFGLFNDEVVLQEFLTGIEYVVDSVSCQGVHYTTNVAKYEKEILNGSFLYKVIDYTYPIEGEISNILRAYNDSVLDALGIQYGPSHSEIMLTEAGPVVVETGARMHGGRIPPMLVERCSEHSLIEMVVDSYVDIESYKKRTEQKAKYIAHGAGFCFINKKSGVVTSIPGLETVKGMSSLFGLHKFVNEGDFVEPTKDLFSSPMWVFIANDDKKLFEEDLNYLRKMNDDQKLLEIS